LLIRFSVIDLLESLHQVNVFTHNRVWHSHLDHEPPMSFQFGYKDFRNPQITLAKLSSTIVSILNESASYQREKMGWSYSNSNLRVKENEFWQVRVSNSPQVLSEGNHWDMGLDTET